MENEIIPAIEPVVLPDRGMQQGKVVHNAFKILRVLGRIQRPMGVSELAKELGIPKTTTQRLLEQMAWEAVVVHRDHKWVMGAGFRNLDQRSSDWADIAGFHMQAMTRVTGVTLFLYAGSGDTLNTLSQSYGPNIGRFMTASEQIESAKHPASAISQALERGKAASDYGVAHPKLRFIATPFSLPSGERAVLGLAQLKSMEVEPFKHPLDRLASLIHADLNRLASGGRWLRGVAGKTSSAGMIRS